MGNISIGAKLKRSLLNVRNRKSRSITTDLIIGLILTVVLVSTIAISLSYFKASQRAKAQLVDKVEEYKGVLTQFLEIPLWHLDHKAIKQMGMFYAQNELVAELRIIDSLGTVYFDMEKEGVVPTVTRASEVWHNGESIGYIEISLTSAYYQEINQQLLWASIFTIGINLLSLIIMTGFLLRRFLRKPLKDLGEIVNSYASGKYDSSGHRMSFIEFQPFVAVLGEMGDRIKSQMTELRKHQEHLEGLVKERTSGLEEKTIELEQANIRLQEMDRLKSVFLASMSHELRTPLNSIIGFTGIMLQGMAGEVNEEQRKQLTMVENSASHLLSLINDVLDISKVEAGKVELSLEEFRLDGIAGEVVETLSPAANEKGLELVTEVPDGVMLFSDRRRMKQVLMNLAVNAVKFTDQGNVTIAARVPGDENLEIRVTDTGMGIKKEHMDKLFQPFPQIDVSLNKRHEGTGLGLHLSKKLVNLLGGDISAKSEYGRGSEFTFTIPLRYNKEGSKSESR